MSHSPLLSSVAVATLVVTGTAANADQVINDDLIVTSSICAGFDCVNGEVFDFDTLRLKENNTRLQFNDTSAGSFPTNNWQIRANSSLNAGPNFLGFVDQGASGTSESGTLVFSVAANAGANALFVNAGGNVGFGTGSPVVKLHATNGNTPTLRLEQSGTSGFTPQTWDLAGNEANFFLRDVTNASRLVFRVQPNAPSNSIFTAASGNVGLGTAAPAAALHIDRNAPNPELRLEANGGSFFTFRDETNQDSWFITKQNVNDGNLEITSQRNGTVEAGNGTIVVALRLTPAGNMTITGGLVTGTAGSCTLATPCDAVFDPALYSVPSIEEHAAVMWQNKYLPAVGPTDADMPINVSERVLTMLNELEHAHIYIEQLNAELKTQSGEIDALRALMFDK